MPQIWSNDICSISLFFIGSFDAQMSIRKHFSVTYLYEAEAWQSNLLVVTQ